MATISPSRRTPFSEGVEAAGVKAYTVHNHMLLPTVFKTNVAFGMVRMTDWDAGAEIKVETPDGMRDVTIRDAFWL